MGDVQGHGLSAVGTVASLLGAFREAVLDERNLEAAAARLERRLVVDSSATEHAELFSTALLMEFSRDASTVRIVSCGHPPPLLMRDGEVIELEVEPGAPIGLGLFDVSPPKERTVSLRHGDRLFLASDGVTEGRNRSGDFYPLPERLVRFADEEPAALTDRVWEDLVRFCTTVRDDVTMLVLSPQLESDP
jgi:serine phosphatase RsbU (regulator of sigma subunit)